MQEKKSVLCAAMRGRYTGENGEVQQHLEILGDKYTNTITTVEKDNLIIEIEEDK